MKEVSTNAKREVRSVSEVHCFNCTPRDNSKLPEKYQRALLLKSNRGVRLCPRCKCPEVAYVDASYTPSYGYNNTTKGK